MGFTDKVVLVSGGTRGIGKAIALSLVEKGAKVALTYLQSGDEARQMISRAHSLRGELMTYQVDMKDPAKVREMVADLIEKRQRIDILINNAGIRKDRTLAFMSIEEWDDVIRTNLSGVFCLTQAVIFHMLKRKSGRIINISSVSGISGIKGQTNYSSSKAGLNGFTKALAKEVASYGISVNALAPGGVDTDMVRSMKEDQRKDLLRNVPMGRLCRLDEVSKMVLFLADRDEGAPDFLTGAVIPLDGGQGV